MKRMFLRPLLKKRLKQVDFKLLETQVEKEKWCKMISMKMSFLGITKARMIEMTVKIDENRKLKCHSKIKWVLDHEMMKLSLRLLLISKRRNNTQLLTLMILIGVDYIIMIVRRIQFKTSFLSERLLFEENETSHFQQSQRTLSNESNESLSIADLTNSLRCSGTSKKKSLQELTQLL